MRDAGRRFRAICDLEQRRVAVGTLVATQSLDVLTTIYGLRSPDVVELNPMAAAVMDAVGVGVAVIGIALAMVCVVVAVTEFAVGLLASADVSSGWIRTLGYGPPAALWFLAATNNVIVIVLA